MSERHDSTHTEKGVSLAKGPAWIVGSVLAVFGLVLFWKAPGTPLPTEGFPDGAATGPTFLGFEINAWTAWLTTAAGVLVLIGVLQHVIAKTMSLLVGIALGVAAAMALIDGDVLGLAAANGWTALGWAVAAAILIIAALLPRRTRTVRDQGATDVRERETVAREARTSRDEHTTRDEQTTRNHDGHDERVPDRVTPVSADDTSVPARGESTGEGRFARHQGHELRATEPSDATAGSNDGSTASYGTNEASTGTGEPSTGQTVRVPSRNRD